MARMRAVPEFVGKGRPATKAGSLKLADALSLRYDPQAHRPRTDTGGWRQRLSAAQVAELAELFDDAPRRAGVVDDILQSAAEGRGMTLVLADRPAVHRSQGGETVSRRATRAEADVAIESGGQQ